MPCSRRLAWWLSASIRIGPARCRCRTPSPNATPDLAQRAPRRPVGPSRVHYPTLRTERLASPPWDEATVNRSGRTTSESGAPSTGRNATLNVARPARRHRPRHSPNHRTGHRTELHRGTGPTGLTTQRCGPPVGQERHEGGEVWAFARRTMSSPPSSSSSKRHQRQVSFVVGPCGATPPTNEHSPPGFSAPCGRRALIVPLSPWVDPLPRR